MVLLFSCQLAKLCQKTPEHYMFSRIFFSSCPISMNIFQNILFPLVPLTWNVMFSWTGNERRIGEKEVFVQLIITKFVFNCRGMCKAKRLRNGWHCDIWWIISHTSGMVTWSQNGCAFHSFSQPNEGRVPFTCILPKFLIKDLYFLGLGLSWQQTNQWNNWEPSQRPQAFNPSRSLTVRNFPSHKSWLGLNHSQVAPVLP